MVSGMAPIRARKIRHYKDRNFTERLLPSPVLEAGLFSDRPTVRGNDWNGWENSCEPAPKRISHQRKVIAPLTAKAADAAPVVVIAPQSEAAPQEAMETPSPVLENDTASGDTGERVPKVRSRKAPIQQQDLFAAYGAPPVRSLLPERGLS